MKNLSYSRAAAFKKLMLRHQPLLRKVAVGSLIAAVLIIGLQLFVPAERLIAFRKIGSVDVGFVDRSEATKKLAAAYREQAVTIKTQAKEYKKSAEEIGLQIDADKTVTQATDYPLWQRFIPGSIIVQAWPRTITPTMRSDEGKMQMFAELVKTENYQAPVNASLQMNGERVTATESKEGYEYPVVATMDHLAKQTYGAHTAIFLPAAAIQPERTQKDIEPLLQTAQGIIDTPLTFTVAGEQFTAPKATIASWLQFNEKDDKTLAISAKEDLLRAYLDTIQKKIYIAPGTTIITIVDGNEVSRQPGTTGRGIDMAATIAKLNGIISGQQKSAPVQVPITDLPPKVTHNRTYSSTQTGLQALLNDTVKEKGDFAISVIELGGRGFAANANGDKKYGTASMYKLFVAYGALKKVESGEWQWNKLIHGDKNLEVCFDIMIVKSDNPCAEEMGNQLGWSWLHGQMKAIGLRNTVLDTKDFASTANDQALFLRKLQEGSLVSAASRDKLLDAMRRQIYRKGIPAGAGAAVANKVGFIRGLLHDGGIVYGGRTYVIVILSNGSTWSNLADATRRVHQLLH